MTNRILDFSNSAAYLHARGATLEVELNGKACHSVPFEEIAALVVAHSQVTFSQSAIARLAEAGGILVVCNDRFMPVAMTMPIESHWYQAERFVKQAAFTVPKKKRLWQQIVRKKIEHQSTVLAGATGKDHGLSAMVPRVLSGDPGNVEAQASRRYWSKLFSDKQFVRANPEDPRNALLNYGYAVLRASTARAIAAAGLHPTFGLHHANKLNAYPLADDLMEPFRPIIDAQVLRILSNSDLSLQLVPKTKHELLSILTDRFYSEGEGRTLFDILARMAQSLARVILARESKFVIGLDSPLSTDEEP
ncbi:type II CRISPR-associated endonuclease Cas1 [Bryobacter aggregatus]|uniref:type II CRISPR-associated endonuclease Cas1 n=1 Tax=Bryobacter aggregatus TaxID=360054 RepID=UPI00138E0902|nr:type II CRISPR-associated endonuclease Cas1 [Bryobacter aggregatus]